MNGLYSDICSDRDVVSPEIIESAEDSVPDVFAAIIGEERSEEQIANYIYGRPVSDADYYIEMAQQFLTDFVLTAVLIDSITDRISKNYRNWAAKNGKQGKLLYTVKRNPPKALLNFADDATGLSNFVKSNPSSFNKYGFKGKSLTNLTGKEFTELAEQLKNPKNLKGFVKFKSPSLDPFANVYEEYLSDKQWRVQDVSKSTKYENFIVFNIFKSQYEGAISVPMKMATSISLKTTASGVLAGARSAGVMAMGMMAAGGPIMWAIQAVGFGGMIVDMYDINRETDRTRLETIVGKDSNKISERSILYASLNAKKTGQNWPPIASIEKNIFLKSMNKQTKILFSIFITKCLTMERKKKTKARKCTFWVFAFTLRFMKKMRTI